VADRVRTGVKSVVTDLSGCLSWFSPVYVGEKTALHRDKPRYIALNRANGVWEFFERGMAKHLRSPTLLPARPSRGEGEDGDATGRPLARRARSFRTGFPALKRRAIVGARGGTRNPTRSDG
jgi:hypothetical protein